MDPALYTAAAEGDIEVLKTYKDQLLKQVTSPAKNTVLHVIAQYRDSANAISEILWDMDFGLVETLLTWKNAEGETALYIAARNRRQLIVKQLLGASARRAPSSSSPDLEDGDGVLSLTERMVRISNIDGDTPLHQAVNNKDKLIVELLVKADPNYQHLPNNMGKTPLYLALEKRVSRDNDYPIAVKLIKDIVGSVISRFEDKFGSYDPSLKAILEVCKKPGIEGPNGETVLHAAARWEETAEWIAKICDLIPNIRNKQESQGFTALHHAAYFNNYSAIEYLISEDKSTAYITAAEDKHDSMTPLHIAVSKGHIDFVQLLLEICPDCWNGRTSKGQNILHLAALGQHTECIKFIMEQPWGINLLNMKDNNGNTPSHLLLSSVPKNYNTLKTLLHHPNVSVDVFNKENYTPLEMLGTAEIEFNTNKTNILFKLMDKFWPIHGIPWTINDGVKENSKTEDNKTRRLEEMKKTSDTHLLVAALIATVTFAAGFTLPGGFDGNPGNDQGMAVLIKKAAFKAFIVTDTIGLISSCIAIFLHFTATLYKRDEAKISNRYSAALMFLVIAMISMAITFVTGLYVVLEKSPALAITVSVIGCCGILYLLYLIRKVYRDKRIFVEELLFLVLLLVVPAILLCLVAIVLLILVAVVYYSFEKGKSMLKRAVRSIC